MTDSQLDVGKLEHYLIIHKHAILAWGVFVALGVGVSYLLTVTDPTLRTVPWSDTALLPLVWFALAWCWLVAGIMGGWFPRRVNT